MGKTYKQCLKQLFDFHSTNLYCALSPGITSIMVECSKLINIIVTYRFVQISNIYYLYL